MIGVPRGSTNPRRKEWVWRRMDHALFRLGNMWLGLSPIQLLMILVFPCSGLAPFELIPTWNANIYQKWLVLRLLCQFLTFRCLTSKLKQALISEKHKEHYIIQLQVDCDQRCQLAISYLSSFRQNWTWCLPLCLKTEGPGQRAQTPQSDTALPRSNQLPSLFTSCNPLQSKPVQFRINNSATDLISSNTFIQERVAQKLGIKLGVIWGTIEYEVPNTTDLVPRSRTINHYAATYKIGEATFYRNGIARS